MNCTLGHDKMNEVCMCCDCGKLDFLYALLSRDMTSSVPPRMQRQNNVS